MTPATRAPGAGSQGPSFKTAILGFFLSNVVLTTGMVLLGSLGG
jgi:hypothetical protein